MNKKENYNIGLDIGVASVGWCVTDDGSNLLKKGTKNMWGSRIFKEANTAAERRKFRGNRRRIDRRKERINMLQSLVIEDMEKEYPNFFQMLKESSLDFEDKLVSPKISGIKYNLFSDTDMTDKEYYKKYPTIYHLRKNLIINKEKADLRLVYLAIHHIIKYRGNFLYEGDFSENTQNVKEEFEKIKQYLYEKYQISLNRDVSEILNLLSDKHKSKSEKKDILISYFDFDKEEKQVVVNTINAILGYKFSLSKIFDVSIEREAISFSSEIENEDEIKSSLEDDVTIFESMNTMYSWNTLQDILNGNEYISDALIKKYEKYNEDLKLLKKVYKEYFYNEYNDMFRKEQANNYVAFNGKNRGENCKKCKPEEFYNMLKNKIKELPDECKEKLIIENDLKNDNFLKKINVTENGAIPHQLHEKELIKILENQSKYYSSIKNNKEKILSIFSFKIPYYVGPLSKNDDKWSWIVRNSQEKIRPWNFKEVINEDETAEKFITRMTNNCTYLINKKVIAKSSLLYSKFCVLNELNNIKVNGKHLGKDIKMKIIDNLFKKTKVITKKKLQEFLKIEGMPYDSITGLTDNEKFNSNMVSYIDLEKILGEINEDNYEMCENIIYWITIFEEKKILKRKIKAMYKELNDNQIDKLCKLRYTGWSRLSKELLTELKSNDKETIIEKLEKTSLNFMQIINNKKYGFDKQIEDQMPKIESNIKYSDIEEIPTSPANKRAIWQTICVVKEIKKIMKSEPKNIYIEFARNEEKKVMKDNRAKQLLKTYEKIENELSKLKNYNHKVYLELKAHQSDKLLTEKMYLYIMQNGKCLYSGKTLDFDNLSLYEVDHIIPQSYIKDDSIDNKALVIKSENQRKKDSLLLSDDIINARIEWWKSLLDNNLISPSKYFRLIKRKMFETDEDRYKFVQRQLVETRQITKYVTNLLKNTYSNTDVYAIRSELTHRFREKYNIYKNRNVNNYHHAQDAYVLNVIGNIVNNKLKYREEFKYSEYVKKYFKDENNQKEKHGTTIGMISKYVDTNKVKHIMAYKDCNITIKLEEGTGEFYNQTLYSPKDRPKIRLKNNKDTAKYGGYSGENKAYLVIYKYNNKKGLTEYELVGIPINIAYDIKNKKYSEEKYIEEYILKGKEYSNLIVIKRRMLINQQYLDENNELMRFCSDSEIRPSKELVLNKEMNELVYLLNTEKNKLDDKEKEKLIINYEYMFNYLITKLKQEYYIFNSIYNKLLKTTDKFNNLSENDKKLTINGLIDLMEKGQGNLKAIGLTEREGRMKGKKFKTEKLLNMIFIEKSITGIYERRFKLDGMENSCSK